MTRPSAALNRLSDRLALVLPEHVFTWHRANGHVTVKFGTRAQLMAIGSAVLVAGWLGVATSSMISGTQTADVALAAKQAELARMQSQLTAMQSQTAAVQGSVATTAHELEARQAFLASLIGGKQDLRALAKMLPRATGDSLATARDLLPAKAKVLEPFRDIANQQLAFVDQATGAAEAKLRDTEALIRRVGLDPSRFAGASAIPSGGVGGPYVPVSAPADAEPRFKSLYMSWQKLAAMQAAVASIPSYMPVKNYSYTSSFGVRYDPFNGGAAMHQGTDMAGAHGEPIYAAANGTVALAGVANGYGNVVEIEHGKGIETRYGHLSAILVHAGDQVRQGQLIGRMGSTGRSTGTHLHYEIRVDGRAVNARPFLDASAYVLAAQASAPAQAVADQPRFEPVAEDMSVTAQAIIGGMTPIHLNR